MTVYMDHAATTPLRRQALDAMLPYFCEEYGNPSAGYSLAGHARKALREARAQLAEGIGCAPEEIFFTCGGTESDNWAIKSVAQAAGRGHIITSKIEHPAVLNTCAELERQGFSITYLPVLGNGRVDPVQVLRAIRQDTILISIMYANNEVGTIQPVAEIAELAAAHGIPFHTDAVQAYGSIPVSVSDGFSMMSVSAHKWGGPKGVGFLYVNRRYRLKSFLHGGGQELGIRSGTENVPGIVGMAAASKLAMEQMRSMDYVIGLRESLWERLNSVVCCERNSPMVDCLPGHLNVSFAGVEAEQLLACLDIHGICVSGGSACSNVSRKPSHVLSAMGMKEDRIKGAIRFTLGQDNTLEQLCYVVDVISEFMERQNRV